MRCTKTMTALLSAGLLCACLGAVDITIHTSQRYQTIVGFGAYANITPWLVKPSPDLPFYEDVDLAAVGFYDSLARDMSVMRTEISPYFQTSPDGAYEYPSLHHLKELAARGLTQFISSVWSPPAYMKNNNRVENGGYLKPSMYEAFGYYCAEWLKHFENTIGVPLYALSPQNEPLFGYNLSYKSCVYTTETYVDMLGTIGPILEREAPKVRLFGPEDMTKFPDRFINVLATDQSVKPYLDIVASHGYGDDGILPGEAGAETWASIYDNAGANGHLTAMTETSGYENTWAGAMDLAKSIYGALKHGKISLWTWWSVMDKPSAPKYGLILDSVFTSRYYVHAQYGRCVRPGAVMVKCSSGDNRVLALAFVHDEHNTMSIVLTNTAGAGKSVALSGTGSYDEFSVFRTSGSENAVNVGTVASSQTITLPASSVTTLYSGEVTAAGAVDRSSRAPTAGARVRRSPVEGCLFTLDGRRVRGGAGGGGVLLDALGRRMLVQ